MTTVTFKRSRTTYASLPAGTAGFVLAPITTILHRPDPQPFNAPCDLPDLPPVDAAISHPLDTSDPVHEAHYYAANTVDPANDLDGSQEFDDSDGSEDEALDGFTVFTPANTIALRRWLKGYDVL